MDRQITYVTHLELIQSQQLLKDDVVRRVDVVDEKVDNLKDMVLPLIESSKQTADNTKKIAESMDKFTDAQRVTNGNVYEKINGHDVEIASLNIASNARSDIKKANATVLVQVIILVAAIITGLFNLAPYLFK